ncbi:hypothetical protein [Shewanella chilikensis]|uniref:hypothetical protein n=1 Tax=Shewanella chilikensis TaxID=558541 RepID=UPI00399BCFDF
MENKKKYELAVKLIGKFNYFKDNAKFTKFYSEISRSGEISPDDLTPIYNHMVNISNNYQQGAIVNGQLIRKIWNSLNLLARRNAELEEENIRLKESLERIKYHTNKLSNEFS